MDERERVRIRTYGVRFGDAILISVPDEDESGAPLARHILMDVGNVLSGEGGADAVFAPVIADISRELGGRPLDLYVVTHEHMDHVQGLYHAAVRLGLRLDVDYAWLTASAAPDYYNEDKHPDARRRRPEMLAAYDDIARYVQAAPEDATAWAQAMLLNNNPRSTEQCVDYIRGLARHTAYVYRGCELAGTHPFRAAQFAIWAPEEDTADYYGLLQPMALGLAPQANARRAPSFTEVLPPAGVDAGAFYNLVDARCRGYGDNLLAIDRAANNTSVVMALEWRGRRLLFTGDAEQRSWRAMASASVLAPVDFLKVSHHGSHTGVPAEDLIEQLLPAAGDARARVAVVSTYPDTYAGVPDRELVAEALGPRCDVRWVDKGAVGDGEWLDCWVEPGA
ncbi:MAG: hypothetical protein V1772_12190 [Chloroflexota bacterium]